MKEAEKAYEAGAGDRRVLRRGCGEDHAHAVSPDCAAISNTRRRPNTASRWPTPARPRADDLGIMSQIYYLQKDCKNSAVWADKAIAAARKAGEAPKENLYQFKLQCASDAGDTPAMAAHFGRSHHASPTRRTYWNTLLRIERQDERDDHNTLMMYRVMYDTGSMTAGTDYIEMAQLLGDAALPARGRRRFSRRR